MADQELTPLGALARGILAGLAGTAAMTAHQELVGRLRSRSSSASGSGSDDSGDERDPWENAPAPALVARRLLEGVFRRDVSAERIGLLTNAAHWLYGTSWGGAYGLVAASAPGRPLAIGPLFGAGVWAMSYAQLVPMGLYEPPWTCPPKALANDLGYHLTYGLVTALAYEALDR